MAEYNRWMNARLFAAAATLDADTLAADKGAFFGSIQGTLNHLAVADTIWLHRFSQHAAVFASLGALSRFSPPATLSAPVAPDFAGLQNYRQALDALIERWVAELTAEHLAANLIYRSMAGVEYSRPFGALLQHFFNHQTHHRGQVTTLLHQAGVDVGATDFLAVIPQGVL